MEKIQDAKALRFLDYWEQRFNMMLDSNTNWIKLFVTLDSTSVPNTINIDNFCTKYSKDFNVNIHYYVDDINESFDLTITR